MVHVERSTIKRFFPTMNGLSMEPERPESPSAIHTPDAGCRLRYLSLSHASPVAAVLVNVLASSEQGKECAFEAAYYSEAQWQKVWDDYGRPKEWHENRQT
jgi:hypothetical protein